MKGSHRGRVDEEGGIEGVEGIDRCLEESLSRRRLAREGRLSGGPHGEPEITGRWSLRLRGAADSHQPSWISNGLPSPHSSDEIERREPHSPWADRTVISTDRRHQLTARHASRAWDSSTGRVCGRWSSSHSSMELSASRPSDEGVPRSARVLR